MGKHGEYKYEIGEIVNDTLRIVDQIRVKRHRGYIVQSTLFPNAPTYETTEYILKDGSGCAYTSGHRICEESSLWGVETIRKNIIDVDEAKNIPSKSNKKIKVKCSRDGCESTKWMHATNLSRRGYSCLNCATGTSYPERFFTSYLTVKSIPFETQVRFDDSQRRIDYKIIVKDTTILVETHGRQHYEKEDIWYKSSFESDNIKRKYARDNGITLIELDCRESDFSFIKNNINNNPTLPNILEKDEVEIKRLIKISSNYDVKTIVKMYESGLSAYKIGNKLNLSSGTIYGILKRNGVKRRG